MAVADWARVKELLHQAMPLAPEDRARLLDEACSSDAELRAEVESLLLADEGVRSSFLRSSPAEGLGTYRSDPAGALQTGQVFAQHFQLVRKLGEGGMGQVWLAEQTSPVRRQVALKLIKAGMYDEAIVQRFQSERQSLAIMDHPAIAKVFDAGATPQGQPYFVMEYVPGSPITEYCDQKKLTIKQRLDLFVQACEGVQHAHQKALIHRDLKPANILVVEVDGKPGPRLIDFGLAKAIAPLAEGESLFTQVGHLVGTPGYMSPEQADPSQRDVDTRADVYSLGAVLYVLLTGSRPLDTKQKQPLDEVLRRLREEEPPSPSRKVSQAREASTSTAEARSTKPKQLLGFLRGDLDWITMKALEKDRTRRYGTPSELAADIRRYLNHDPILARPASAGYRLRKYTRRHRVAVGAAAGLVLLFAAFSVLQALELRRTARERDRANRERDRATRITDFMTGMFKVSDPSQARGSSVTAREILDKASDDMRKGLAKDPEVQSQMMQVMASTYENLGLYPRAHELAKRALDIRLSLRGEDDPKTLESMAQLGWILAREGHDSEAENLERQALVGERRTLGPGDPLTLGTMDHLAVVLQHRGHFDEGEKLEREVIEIGTARLGPESPQTLQAINHLGGALLHQARYAEAEKEYRQLLDVERRVWGPDHPETLKALGSLALAIQGQGHMVEAEQLFREVLADQQRVLGPEHQNTTVAIENLGSLLFLEGQMDEAEKLLREAFEIRARTLGPEHPDTLVAKHNLGEVLFKEGHIHQAERLQREVLETRIRVLGPSNPPTLATKADLARSLISEGHFAEAEKMARETFEVETRVLGPEHPNTLFAMQQLATVMALSHRYAQATKLYRDLIAKQTDSGGQGTRWSLWYSFACMAASANHPGDALQYLNEAINHGYKDANRLANEDDLKSLRPNPKFQQLVAELKTPTQKSPSQ